MKPSVKIKQRLPGAFQATIAVLLVGLNLRPAITSLAPVLKYLEADSGLNATAAGLLTSIPLLVFVALSVAAVRLAKYMGYSRAIMASLFVLLLSFVLRILPGAPPLFASMLLAGVAITVGNVLLPAYAKYEYPRYTGWLMAIYTVSLYLGPALTAFSTIPLMQLFGSWRWAIVAWGALVLVALPFWWPHSRFSSHRHNTAASRPAQSVDKLNLWSNPLAWSVALYFAILSVLFYTLSAWLPTLLADGGMPIDSASRMLSLVNFAALPLALITSILVHRTAGQVWLAVAGSLLLLAGLLGVLLGGGGHMVAWMVILGFGNGVATGVAFSLPLLRARSAMQTAALGGMAQTLGYSLSATGPVLAGVLRDLTPYWSPILLSVLAVLVVVQALAGIFAGRARRFVGEAVTD